MEAEKRHTLREIMMMNRDSVPAQISARLCFAGDYDDWCRIVEDAIDQISRLFGETASERQGRDEDGITTDVVTSLQCMGFKAKHDEDVNGHCDIVVRDGPFLWLGEAKVHTAYDALVEGYQQIIHRYSTGAHEQSVGGLLIYVKAANTQMVMDRWAEAFAEKVPDAKTSVCDRRPPALVSIITHPKSGAPFRLRHVPFALHHAPVDKSARASKRHQQ